MNKHHQPYHFRLSRLVGLILLSPAMIVAINSIILFILADAIWSTLGLLRQGDGYELVSSIIEGLGVITIGWGVALEERNDLQELTHLDDLNDDENDTFIDRLCHHHGVIMLVFGLFAEIADECVKLPNTILNTEHIENIVLGISVALIGICLMACVSLDVKIIAYWFRRLSNKSGAISH